MTILPPSDATEVVIPLLTEDFSVERRKIERSVRIQVQTVSHDHLVDEALAQEKVEIERIAIGRPIDGHPPVREEGDTTVISVVEEVLFIERRLVLKEEIHLRRVKTTERHREMVTLRDQEVVIDRTNPSMHESTGHGNSLRPELAPIPKPQSIKEA